MLISTKLHRLAFRHLVLQASAEDLIEAVSSAIMEVSTHDVEVQLHRILVPPTGDFNGMYLVASVLGPTNWHYHYEPLLTRHSIRCQLYA